MSFSLLHLDRLRIRHLRLLELIKQHGSLRAVGYVLNLTQPAVSQMVKDLEFAFGVTLIDRSARGVTLSAAGEIALQRVRSGLASVDHLASELQANQTPMLRIGTNSALLFQILPDALRRVHSGNAELQFKIHTGIVGNMMQALLDGQLDCYVGRIDWDQIASEHVGALKHEPLAHTDLVLACSKTHPLAGRKNPSARDLVGWSWALPPLDSSNRIALETELRNLGLEPPTASVEVAADPNALIVLAKQLELLTCVPRLALETHMMSEQLCVLEVPDLQLPPVQIFIVTLVEYSDFVPLKDLARALAEVTALDRAVTS